MSVLTIHMPYFSLFRSNVTCDNPRDVCNYPFHIFHPRPKRQRCILSVQYTVPGNFHRDTICCRPLKHVHASRESHKRLLQLKTVVCSNQWPCTWYQIVAFPLYSFHRYCLTRSPEFNKNVIFHCLLILFTCKMMY